MTCKWCNRPLERRPGESDSNFKRRKTCDRQCAALYREAVKK